MPLFEGSVPLSKSSDLYNLLNIQFGVGVAFETRPPTIRSVRFAGVNAPAGTRATCAHIALARARDIC